MQIPKNGLIIGVSGTSLSTMDRKHLESAAVGGVILFSHNLIDEKQIQMLVREIKSVRPEIIICIDQEGGRVQRIRSPLITLPPMANFGLLYDEYPQRAIEAASITAMLMAKELQALGIDLSFAPVVDLPKNQSVIGDRAFHEDVGVVIELASAWLNGMAEAGMPGCIKHFPGHGAVHEDTHVDVGLSDCTLKELEDNDLRPFIEIDAPMQMIAHVVVPSVDSISASLSQVWLTQLLREKYHYKGVIVSDDITMKGIVGGATLVERANMAFEAGADIVLWCHELEKLSHYLAAADVGDETYTLKLNHSTPHWEIFQQSEERFQLLEQMKQALNGELS